MSEVLGEAVIELRGDTDKLDGDVRRGAKKAGKTAGDDMGKEFNKSLGQGFLQAGSRISGILTVAGAAGPAVLAAGSAMSALAAGGTAVAGALGPAAAAGLVTYATGLLAVKSAGVVTKFAMDGIAKAAGGDAAALKKLSPEARSLATTLSDLSPRVDTLRSKLQGSLFAGIGPVIGRLANNYFPLLNRAAEQTGTAMNKVAIDGAKLANTGPFRKDFSTIAGANAKNIGNMGQAGLSLGNSLRSLLVTSTPLTRQFFKFAQSAAASVDASVQAGRASGALGKFFDRAAVAGATLGRIAGNIAVGLFNVFRVGARVSGGALLKNLETITGRFREWSDSGPGIKRITGYFQDGQKNLAAMARLTTAVATGLSSLGTGKQLAPLVDQITRDLVPPMIEFLHNASASGALSTLIDAVSSLAEVFAALSANDGSLTAFAGTLRNLADAAKFVITNVPGASKALGVLFTVLGTYGALKLVGLGGAVRSLAAATFTLGTNSAGAARTFGTLRAEMAAANGFAGRSAVAMSALGGAARLAGGVAGIGLVINSSNRSSKALGVLQAAAGGALAGGALGAFAGPPGAAIGAAIGGIGGAIFGLVKANQKAADAAKAAAAASKSGMEAYAATLDSVTGKVTALTRQETFNRLNKSGLLKVTQDLGFSDREAVAAATSNGAARQKVVGNIQAMIAITKQGIAIQTAEANNPAVGQLADKNRLVAQTKVKEYEARLKGLGALQKELGLVDKAVLGKQREAAATRVYTKALNTLPKNVRTDIKTNGMEPTRKAVVDLTRKYNLTPKNVRTLIKENGGAGTKKQVEAVIAAARRLDQQRPKVTVTAETGAARAAIDSFVRAQDARRITIPVGVTKARAKGGPVSAGTPYLVGEEGPELITPSRSGFVQTARQTQRILGEGAPARGGDRTANINVYLPTGDPEAAASAVASRWVMAGVGG